MQGRVLRMQVSTISALVARTICKFSISETQPRDLSLLKHLKGQTLVFKHSELAENQREFYFETLLLASSNSLLFLRKAILQG